MGVEAIGIKNMWDHVMANLEKDSPSLARIVLNGGYFVTRNEITLVHQTEVDGELKKVRYPALVTIIDFTSKQVEHKKDFDTYSNKIMDNFYKKSCGRVS